MAGVNFRGEKSAVASVLVPAFTGMLLFRPLAILARWNAPEWVLPILAIVMSMHRPVIGWSYGRPALVPAAVSAAYLVTVLAILLDVKRVARSPSAAFA